MQQGWGAGPTLLRPAFGCPRGRAPVGGGAPELRRPWQRRKAPHPGTPFGQPHSAQQRPARAYAAGPVLVLYTHTNRTRETRVTEPRPPASEDGRPGEGQRLTPDAPHNRGRPVPDVDGPPLPPRHAAPTGHANQEIVLGPHTRTPAPKARGQRTPTACPEGGQPGEGKRLNSDAPHNGERHPPRGRPSATPTARNNGSQGHTIWGRCW